jgi:hypothetical protein
MWSLNLEQTGEIIQFSELFCLPFEFEAFTLGWLAPFGDLLWCKLRNFLLDGAGDLNALSLLETGVWLGLVGPPGGVVGLLRV